MKLKSKKPVVEEVEETAAAPAPKAKGKRGRKPKNKKETPASFDLDEFMEGINKEYGEGTIFRASDAKGLEVTYLKTGSVRLDIALGGGFPEARMSEIFGPQSAGKTTLLLHTIGEFQKKYKTGLVCFIDFERTLDKKYAEKCGCDLERLIYINPDHGEQGADLLDKCLRQKTQVLIIVDSIAAMAASSTMEIKADENQMGVHARMINRMVAKVNARMKRNLLDPDFPKATVIFTNQIREKIGVMFGNPETTPGGRGKDFFASLRLKIFSSGSSQNKIEKTITKGGITKKVLCGRLVSFTVEKNKSGGTPFDTGEFVYYIKNYKGYPAWTYDNEDALFEAGRFHGCITVNDEGGFEFGEISTKKPHLFIEALRNDPDSAEALYEQIISKVTEFNGGDMEEEDEKEEN